MGATLGRWKLFCMCTYREVGHSNNWANEVIIGESE